MWGLVLSMLGLVGLNPVPYLASLVYTTEPGLNLFISVLMSYPISIIYHKYIRDHTQYRELFFILAGIDMAFFNFGFTMYHNLVPVFIFYFTTILLGPGKHHAILTFTVNMTYLTVGYYMTESNEYDIIWTMPHCVLTLKLIALSFDLWDGKKLTAGEQLSINNKTTALQRPPRFIDLLGFIYFPPGFLVGPMFSFKRYSDYISNKFPFEENGRLESEAWKRWLQGIGYMLAFQIGGTVFSMSYMTSDKFWEHSIIYRHFYCGLWAHFALYKYISCWLLSEAGCIRFGFSYNGKEKTPDGQTVIKWDGCNNIKLLTFESATKFQHYIDSFNCNTNYFAAEYIYKRLKFLGNKVVSQLLTLVFLAVWHGIGSGYYMCFFTEFLIILFEKDLEAILIKTDVYHRVWAHPVGKCVLYAVLKVYTIVFMGWSLVPFDLKEFSKWWNVYCSLYFSGFVLFLPWSFVYKPLLISVVRYLNLAPSML